MAKYQKRQKTELPNNCWIGTMTVIPANWNTKNADMNVPWRIQYNFHDPTYAEKYPNGYRVSFRVANDTDILKKRQEYVKLMLQDEISNLKAGYNPILKRVISPKQLILDPYTPLTVAMEWALGKKKYSNSMMIDLKSALRYFSQAASNISMNMIPIKDVGKKHIKAIFEELGNVKGEKWTNVNYNAYRRNLMTLFSELEEWEIIEDNPVAKLKIKDYEPAKKKALTEQERQLINTKLKELNYPFYRFLQIFFTSGARMTEIVNVQKEDVNLDQSEVEYSINKGTKRRRIRAITKGAWPYWKELYDMAAQGDYIFSEGLVPGPVSIRSDQIRKRWKLWCKDKLGITKSAYSLKHLNTTLTRKALGAKVIATQNQHTEAIMTKVYDLDAEQDAINQVKNIDHTL